MRRQLVQQFSEEQMAKVDAVIEAHRKVPGALLIALEKAQDITLYLPVDLQRYIASKMGVPPSKVSGVVTSIPTSAPSPGGARSSRSAAGRPVT